LKSNAIVVVFSLGLESLCGRSHDAVRSHWRAYFCCYSCN